MTPIVPSSAVRSKVVSTADRRSSKRVARPRYRETRPQGVAKHQPPPVGRPLGRYTSTDGRLRELVMRPGAADSTLVIDRDAATLCDRRLVAHLASDEPVENIDIVCDRYLADRNRSCRRVEREDLTTAPFEHARAFTGQSAEPAGDPDLDSQVIQLLGSLYRLTLLPLPDSHVLQLRWSRRPAADADADWEPASLRDLVGGLESYEPPLTLTATALAYYADRPDVSLSRMRIEFDRVCASSIVLNRGLREAVLRTMSTRGTSLSEIAHRCGMVKRDHRGHSSGEASWLARRIGLKPEGGCKVVTPWIRSEVLALIARRGLGISPREVEL